MTYFPTGKYVTVDKDNPEAVGICDYSGFVFPRKDLIRQMEWRGNRLVWTGFLVGRPYVDQPNPQLRPPILPPDPIPVINPRLPQGSNPTWSTMQQFWQNILDPYNVLGYEQYGVPALPNTQRLTDLNNYHWNMTQ